MAQLIFVEWVHEKKVYLKWNSISKTMERFEQMMTQEKYKSGSSGGNRDGS